MNNFLLAIFSAAMLVFSLGLNKDFLRPSVVFSVGFLYSSLILAANTNNWDYELSMPTVLLISASQLAFWLGERLGFRVSAPPWRQPTNSLRSEKILDKRADMLFGLGFVLCLSLLLVRARNVSNIVAAYGTGDYLLASVRAYGRGEESFSAGLKFLEVFCSVFAYHFLHRFFWLSSRFNVRRFRYLILISMLIIASILSSDRSGILGVIFVSTLIWLFTLRSLNRQISIPFKTVRNIFLVLLTGLFLFAALGNLTGKTQRFGVVDSIMVYSAGSLGALDIFLQSHDKEPQFGYHTFESIKRIGSLLGFKVKYNSDYYGHGDFVIVGRVTNNIYTCFRHYVFDYGWMGTEILLILLGACWGFYYRKFVFFRLYHPVNYVIYSNLVLFVFFSFLTERMFAGTLTATMIAQVVAFLLLYAVLPMPSDGFIRSQSPVRGLIK